MSDTDIDKDVEDYDIAFNFDTNVSFKCKKCGGCCGQNLIMLTYPEINEINAYLEKIIDSEKFNDFIWNCVTLNRPDLVGDMGFLEECKKKMFNYYSFGGVSIDKNIMHPISYILRRTGESLCPFLNILTKECFINSVKPLICQQFPFTTEFSTKEKFAVIRILDENLFGACGLSKSSNQDEGLLDHLRTTARKHIKYQIAHNNAMLSSLKKRGIIKPNIFDNITKEELLNPKSTEELEESNKEMNKESMERMKNIDVSKVEFIDIFQEDSYIQRKNKLDIRDYGFTPSI